MTITFISKLEDAMLVDMVTKNYAINNRVIGVSASLKYLLHIVVQSVLSSSLEVCSGNDSGAIEF